MATINDVKAKGEVIEVTQNGEELTKEIFTYKVEKVNVQQITDEIAMLILEKERIEERILAKQALLA